MGGRKVSDEATDRIVALETLLGDVVKELREVCGEMPDHWVQFDVGYLRNLAKRLEHLTGGEVQKSTNTAPAEVVGATPTSVLTM